jgi:hypothetical protein
MAASTKTIRRSIASLNLTPSKVSTLVTYSQGIVKGMTGNPAFPSSGPALAALSAAVNDLQTAETAALARTKGAVALRNEKRAALVLLLQQLRGDVQEAADANIENGASIIQGAGMGLRKTPVHTPRVFDARPGAVSGSAKLVAASAGARSSYEWQYSTDGGKTWATAPSTIQAKTTIPGLMPGSTAQFKYRTVTKTGEGDWSQVVSLIVK